MTDSKACSRCKQIKPASEFDADKRLKSGLKASCKPCRKIINATSYEKYGDKRRANARGKYWEDPIKAIASVRKYQESNPDKVRENNQNFRANNPLKVRQYRRDRRTRMANNKSFFVSEKEQARLYASPCFACGSFDRIEVEHLIPVTRNGDDGIGNLVALCKPCNLSKLNKTWMEWRVWRMKRGKPPLSAYAQTTGASQSLP